MLLQEETCFTVVADKNDLELEGACPPTIPPQQKMMMTMTTAQL